jgi:hypothetical protein
MLGLWFQETRQKWRAHFGMLSCTFMTFVAASSGALLTILSAGIGFCLWPLREQMRWFRRGILLAIVVLSLVMNAPVWYLIAKVSDVMGGTGWHRSYLIDQAVQHFTQWCWIGSSYTANWAPAGQVLAVDPDNMDITNHYIAQGLHGGIIALGLFIALIVTGFKIIGRALQTDGDLILDRRLIWAFGVGLACHCTAFLSISYFDQIQVFWLWLLAAIASLAAGVRQDEEVLDTDAWSREVIELNGQLTGVAPLTVSGSTSSRAYEGKLVSSMPNTLHYSDGLDRNLL